LGRVDDGSGARVGVAVTRLESSERTVPVEVHESTTSVSARQARCSTCAVYGGRSPSFLADHLSNA
jgi:hypothetical protein